MRNSPSTAQRKGREIPSDGSGRILSIVDISEDVDLNEKLAEWERFYNLDRPHGAFKGKTPYEALRSMLE